MKDNIDCSCTCIRGAEILLSSFNYIETRVAKSGKFAVIRLRNDLKFFRPPQNCDRRSSTKVNSVPVIFVSHETNAINHGENGSIEPSIIALHTHAMTIRRGKITAVKHLSKCVQPTVTVTYKHPNYKFLIYPPNTHTRSILYFAS